MRRLRGLKDTDKPDLDVWASSDAAMIHGMPLPVTAQDTLLPCSLVVHQKAKHQLENVPFRFHNAGSPAYIGGGQALYDRTRAWRRRGGGGGAVRVTVVAVARCVLHHDAELEEQAVARFAQSLRALRAFVIGKQCGPMCVSRIVRAPHSHPSHSLSAMACRAMPRRRDRPAAHAVRPSLAAHELQVLARPVDKITDRRVGARPRICLQKADVGEALPLREEKKLVSGMRCTSPSATVYGAPRRAPGVWQDEDEVHFGLPIWSTGLALNPAVLIECDGKDSSTHVDDCV
ncbi:uncharacterized protein C8Q71DRAFT_784935 [Rhodofomes roseus]|uniref:Uncharacterized protein n=1 Tax=Rhodofomes roseus TaxID=34475 RepID=A0ABQ8K1K4_9APHY|nr:uncharacterized protein C8Q71DRAFT_784935 [Rhodofomes roseus]KAH9830569.1 hypothetical protein C8Q71DRAFT_784935 [Rhodofomes roseus]